MPVITPAKKAAFHRVLQAWYKIHGRRNLPWRNTRDPYAIYISEIMLQQTQVKTVLERYYTPFLKAFPTLRALAQADKQAVVKQWEGLGYYTRAANLHAAARKCDGTLPKTAEALVTLPGIGRNTAHAIACFAYGEAVPVMEANVRRVLCRVFAMKEVREDILWEKAAELLDTRKPFDYNQAMMDIGALVCKKREPLCTICPLKEICQGKYTPESYPAPKVKKSTPVRERVIVVLRDPKGRYYMRQRETRFLHGLYGFPEYAVDTKSILHKGRRYLLKRSSLIGQVKQVYSHFTLEAMVYCIDVAKGSISEQYGATITQIKKLPLSRADQKILALLTQN